MLRNRQKIGEILITLKVLKEPDVKRILEALQRRPDRKKFGQMGLSMGLLREEQILAALAVQMDLFPGIDRLSLEKILQLMQEPNPVPPLSSQG
jgi:hypothetical protein